MKTLYFLFSILFSGIFTKAQLPELVNNSWNLKKITLAGTEYYFPNSESTINAKAIFTSDSFKSSICNSLLADVTYNNGVISFISSTLTLGSCPDFNNNEYNIFENRYFGQFFGANTTNGIYASYNYLIENIGDNLKLMLTNPNGDKAIYRSQGQLSVNDVASSVFKIHPNPVETILTIETEKLSNEFSATIFDMQGKVILKQIFKNAKISHIDLSKLLPGIYILNIKNKDENYTTKILKK